MTDRQRRKATLRSLIDLARGSDPVACWDPERALQLLRGQSSIEELQSFGFEAEVIEMVFGPRGEGHGGRSKEEDR